MQFIEDKNSGKVVEVFMNEAQKNAYYFEVICDHDIEKMRKARLELDKRIDQLVSKEIEQYRKKALCAEKSLVYALGNKTADLQKGLYYSLVELQPLASFCYKADIAKLKEKYKLQDEIK